MVRSTYSSGSLTRARYTAIGTGFRSGWAEAQSDLLPSSALEDGRRHTAVCLLIRSPFPVLLCLSLPLSSPMSAPVLPPVQQRPRSSIADLVSLCRTDLIVSASAGTL